MAVMKNVPAGAGRNIRIAVWEVRGLDLAMMDSWIKS